MVRTAAIDAGFDALKGIFGGLEGKKVYIPNVVLKMDRGALLGGEEINPISELHVKVTSDSLKESGVYAVGELASRSSVASQGNILDRKGTSDQALIVLLTAVALDAVEEDSLSDNLDVTYQLSTGLPIDESKIEGARKQFGDKLKNGSHLVEFMKTPNYEGKKVHIKFSDVFVNTEGHAAMVNITMSDDYKPRNTELLKKNVLIDDMGGNTTDLAVIRNGKIDSDYSTGLPLGIGRKLDDIIDEIFSVHRYQFKTRRELVENIISKTNPYSIRPYDQVVSIKSIVDKHLLLFSKEQYNFLKRTWSNVGNLDCAYIVGGTAYLLKDFILDINKNDSKFDLKFLDDAEESIWSISKAYQKLLILKSKKLTENAK
ncbi:ParM/StbA family protein [Peribacillus muralis]|uniref:ParM/StbA family protein n=1 Tax=Peribacillus muralis TaxID=264697 RepID=UPI003CFC2644